MTVVKPAIDLIERIRRNVPRVLLDLPIWLLHDDHKHPIYADGRNRNGKLDLPGDRACLVMFEEAAQALANSSRASGLGIALGEVPAEELWLSGIDLDHCYHGDELEGRALTILQSADSYAERSLSGNGLHILGTGNIGTEKCALGLEIYSGARYFVVTGRRLNGAGLNDLADAAAVARKLFASASHHEVPPRQQKDPGTFPEGGRNNFLTREAGKLRRLNLSPAAMLAALREINKERCDPPLPDEEVAAIAGSVGRYAAPPAAAGGTVLAFPGLSEERIAELAALPTLTYEARRKEEAKKLGIRAKALDEEVKRVRHAEKPIIFPAVEPWSHPVVGAELLDQIERELIRYLILPPGAVVAITLWVAMTWTTDAHFIMPMLSVLSPQKGCGKTSLLVVLGELCQRPLLTANITPAALFRTVELHMPTLLVDEADSFAVQNDELRGVCNSGHSRRSAYVLRTVGDSHEPRQFSTWCPKALAAIGKLPGTVQDRSVIIRMRRKRPDESAELLRQDRLDMDHIRRRLARWGADHVGQLRGLEPASPLGFDGRRSDNWRPLFAIADCVGGGWPERARAAAITLSATSEDDDPKVVLLGDIRGLLAKAKVDRIRSSDLVDQLVEMETRPWPEWGRAHRPITQTQVARLLREFMIEPRTVRFPGGTAKGYLQDQFIDAWARYLPPLPAVTPSQEPENG